MFGTVKCPYCKQLLEFMHHQLKVIARMNMTLKEEKELIQKHEEMMQKLFGIKPKNSKSEKVVNNG